MRGVGWSRRCEERVCEEGGYVTLQKGNQTSLHSHLPSSSHFLDHPTPLFYRGPWSNPCMCTCLSMHAHMHIRPHLTHTGWSRDSHTSRRLPLLKKKAVWESRNFNQRNQSARASTAASRSRRSAMPARTEPSTPTGARAACTRRAGRRSSHRDRALSSSRSGGEGGGEGGCEGGGD